MAYSLRLHRLTLHLAAYPKCAGASWTYFHQVCIPTANLSGRDGLRSAAAYNYGRGENSCGERRFHVAARTMLIRSPGTVSRNMLALHLQRTVSGGLKNNPYIAGRENL